MKNLLCIFTRARFPTNALSPGSSVQACANKADMTVTMLSAMVFIGSVYYILAVHTHWVRLVTTRNKMGLTNLAFLALAVCSVMAGWSTHDQRRIHTHTTQ